MKCSGCRQPIEAGAFVHAGNVPFHPACFVCSRCGAPLRRYALHKGRFYCISCETELHAPRCAICGEPIAGTYYEHGGGKVHDRCFRSHVASKCDVCGGPLEVRDHTRDAWGYRYHTMHRQQFPPCDACGRLTFQDMTGGGVALGDGRAMCNLCMATAVRSDAVAARRVAAVRSFLEGKGMAFPPREMPIALVARPQLQRLLGKKPHGHLKRALGCTRFEQIIEGSRVVRQEATVYILSALPEALFDGVAAHELGHAWAFLNDCPAHEAPLAEGFCNYLAYLMHQEGGGEENAFYIKMMLEDPDQAYGKGFLEMRRFAERKGMPALLRYMRRSTGIPFWNFF